MKSLMLVATLTAYSACDGHTPCDGITASGTAARYGIVAADWNYWQPGDLVCFGPPIRECMWVEDRGGKIRGPGRFDVYYDSTKEAIQFGVVTDVPYWKPEL